MRQLWFVLLLQPKLSHFWPTLYMNWSKLTRWTICVFLLPGLSVRLRQLPNAAAMSAAQNYENFPLNSLLFEAWNTPHYAAPPANHTALSLHGSPRPTYRAVLGLTKQACSRTIGNPILQMGEQKPPKPPLPFARCGTPSNTAMPRPTPRTTPNRSFDGSRTFAQVRRKVPIG